ncbi:hypothetical protein HU200_049424 [Digitaria exilis]|uniref:Uncharacterized protein n=1 Tax=Digitaria exilis TaxID=1010633 RepID=A0A835ATJ1_9POAL|nr:hypothetical protein HU200_049424 [Digitaria exilis]
MACHTHVKTASRSVQVEEHHISAKGIIPVSRRQPARGHRMPEIGFCVERSMIVDSPLWMPLIEPSACFCWSVSPAAQLDTCPTYKAAAWDASAKRGASLVADLLRGRSRERERIRWRLDLQLGPYTGGRGRRKERRPPVVVGGEAAAVEAEVRVEETHGAAEAEAGSGELSPELRRRPLFRPATQFEAHSAMGPTHMPAARIAAPVPDRSFFVTLAPPAPAPAHAPRALRLHRRCRFSPGERRREFTGEGPGRSRGEGGPSRGGTHLQRLRRACLSCDPATAMLGLLASRRRPRLYSPARWDSSGEALLVRISKGRVATPRLPSEMGRQQAGTPQLTLLLAVYFC